MRRTALRPGSRLTSRKELSPGKPIGRSNPEPVTRTANRGTGRKDTGPSRKVRLLVLERDNYACVCCGRSVIGQPYSLQHRDSRGMGGSSDPLKNSPVNLLTMLGTATTGCHGRVESRRDRKDNARGYWLRMGESPVTTPVMVFSEGASGVTAWPTEGGAWIFEAPAEAAS